MWRKAALCSAVLLLLLGCAAAFLGLAAGLIGDRWGKSDVQWSLYVRSSHFFESAEERAASDEAQELTRDKEFCYYGQVKDELVRNWLGCRSFPFGMFGTAADDSIHGKSLHIRVVAFSGGLRARSIETLPTNQQKPNGKRIRF